MADAKITQLAALATPAGEDLVAVVDDPSGTPVTKKATLSAIASFLFPVGHVILSYVATSPATLYGFGTWALCAAGRFFVGIDAGDSDFDAVGETGGAKTVTLTEAQIPAHTHVQNAHSHNIGHVRSATTGVATTQIARTADTSSTVGADVPTDNATAVNQNAGGGQAHQNLPPYEVIYKWRRVA